MHLSYILIHTILYFLHVTRETRARHELVLFSIKKEEISGSGVCLFGGYVLPEGTITGPFSMVNYGHMVTLIFRW